MSGTIWDAAMAAVAARITAVMTDVPMEQDRRAPVGERECPRLVMQLGRTQGDAGMSPGATFHAIEILVTCHAQGATDTAARIALNTLRARLVAALDGWRGGTIYDVTAGDFSPLEMLDIEASAKPAGILTQAFTVSAITPTASPYA